MKRRRDLWIEILMAMELMGLALKEKLSKRKAKTL